MVYCINILHRGISKKRQLHYLHKTPENLLVILSDSYNETKKLILYRLTSWRRRKNIIYSLNNVRIIKKFSEILTFERVSGLILNIIS